ncbi:hypothetical protein NQT62_04100 [Limnobacter humi]|uniref:Type II secretion system protein GspC N-terminal domain-containing protein n=1 Tax=Limnobacter humi TaxID=1778671 RepID=A0ABT1WDM4_9BURK|nr:hypothetical protein [Limnobacter humi]MCQ8895624.1 hypothetical protein [Limnobacter humi]
MIQSKLRLTALFILLGGLLLLHLLAPKLTSNDRPHHEVASSMAVTPESINQKGSAIDPYAIYASRLKWEPSGEDVFVDEPLTAPPEPLQNLPVTNNPILPSIPKAEIQPVLPPLPYVAMARFKQGQQSVLYLRSGTQSIPVSEGDVLGQGDYRIEHISETMVSIRYLPMNHLYELSLSGLE